MKYISLLVAVLFSTLLFSQKNTQMTKTIEVTGSHEMMVDPDEIIFTISIEEYWAEEFEGKEWKDYKTKIEITEIEENLMKELEEIGIKMKDITLKHSGNYYRSHGKDFLISKNMDIKLKSFKKANEISNILRTRGIKNMHVSEMIVHDKEALILKTQKEALKNAKQKAQALADVYDKEISDVISIVEIDKFVNVRPPSPVMYRAEAMSAKQGGGYGGADYENFKKVKLSYDLRVLFELK